MPATPLTLGQKQRIFSLLVAKLVEYIYEQGYECTLGEAWRPPETAKLYEEQGKGITRSLHADRLAVDLNLFKDGVWQFTTEAHTPFGDWWEKQHELCRWGGRFKGRPDGNHYSFEHGGKK